MTINSLFRGSVLSLALLAVVSVRAWDYTGHRTVNQLALAALPADFPAFVHDPAAEERIAFLAGEPDRWRNVPDLIMRQSGGSWADHYCDMEQIPNAGLDFATVPSFRYDFIVAFAAGRAAHADKFPAIDPAKNSDHTREWPGFLPWAATEYYTRLRSAFMYLKVFEELGTPEEIANARADAIYVMGVMGHYVGDGAQPLHTTIHHDGWVGANPGGYITTGGIHSWVDGGIIGKAHITTASIVARVVPAQPISLAPRPDGREPVFVALTEYLVAQNKLVEPLYQLEKEGKLGNDKVTVGADGKAVHESRPMTNEARGFVEGQLLKGGEMLASIWVTAWRNAGPDTYLRAQLLKRQAAAAAK